MWAGYINIPADLESIPTHTLSNDEDGIVYALDNLVGE